MRALFVRVTSLVAARPAFARLLTLLEWLDRWRTEALVVLMYHRVDLPEARPALYPGLISATPELFDLQMRYLAAHCRVVSMAEVLTARRNSAPLPRRAVLITFDDAYCDFAEHAWPSLKRHGLPATLFVPTAFPDSPGRMFWWDRLYQAVSAVPPGGVLGTPLGRLPAATPQQRQLAYAQLNRHVKSLPHADAMAFVDRLCTELDFAGAEPAVLGWDALRSLARAGLTLGAHTRTHPMMNRISLDEAGAEAVGSLLDLKREIGTADPIFAYPSGHFSSEIARMLEQQGFALAFTTISGINDMREIDWLELKRVNVGRRTTLPILRAELLSWSRHLYRWRALFEG